jgi:hypothetical protein
MLVVISRKQAIIQAAGAEAARASAEEGQLAQSATWLPTDAMGFDKVVDPRRLRSEIITALKR